MCRKHYIEYQKKENPDLAAEIVKELAMAGKKKRAQCSVEGCHKQSQGRVCNGMCRAHFVESGGVVSPSHKPRPKFGMPAEMPPLLAEPPKPTAKADGETGRPKYQCRVEGCTKLSQGRRNNRMCRRHYTIYLEAGGVDSIDSAVFDAPGKKGRRRFCAIPGCSKQSQGKDNLEMCRSHFRAMEKAGISSEELPQWQQSQQMEVALQADGADFAAAVDALPPLPDTEEAVADAAAAVADAAVAVAKAAATNRDDDDEGHDDDDHDHDFADADGDEVAPGEVSGGDDEGSNDDVGEGEDEGNDEEFSLMIQREIQKLKRLERGEDCEEHGVEQYLGDGDNDDNVEAALAASTAAANPPHPGPSPKRPRLESAGPPASPNERAMVKRRQQARDDVEALKAQLQAAQSKEMSVMNAMEGMEECVLCQNEAKAVTMTPCGHSAICIHCAYNENKCPICLEPIDPVDPIEEDGAVAV